MDVRRLTQTGGADEFYPTPEHIAENMLDGIDWTYVGAVLEPSAGKGDLARAIKEAAKKHYRMRTYHDREVNIDCIEIDPHLQHILRGEGFRVVHDDFLKFDTYKRYSLIVMNPPFSNGADHLLKALKMQERGGNIVCLLNAETIRNPHTFSRRLLAQKLDEYNATIDYIPYAFSTAERKTDVEIALIKVAIPEIQEESEIYEKLKKAQHYDEYEAAERNDLAINDYIKAAVAQFNVEAAAGVELIRQYRNLSPHIRQSFDTEKYGNSNPILTLSLYYGGKSDNATINSWLRRVRLKYWEALFSNPKFVGKLTSNLQKEYREMVSELQEYDFSEYNINMIAADMNSKMNRGVEETIMAMFDRLTCEHSWYPETKRNVHYFDGWAHNKAHKINKKVILPCYGVFDNYGYKGSTYFRVYSAFEVLNDIEKVLNFLDGGRTGEVDLKAVIEQKKDEPKNIECKYFKVTFYKKGTVHIVFTNLELLEKFNIYAAKNRRWLPPDYGKRAYRDMTEEERTVVDEFQGEQEYQKVYADNEYYLQTEKVLMIGG